MADPTDFQLLRQYAQTGSEEAFRALVDRHLNLVYSVALSRLANEAEAKDIAQVVFEVLARKAASLSEKVILPGWLFQVTTHACQNLKRAEKRRHRWESEAMQHYETQSGPDGIDLKEIAPVISTALASLSTIERDAILLRFFEEHDFRQVGTRLGISEAAAKMRVIRGLEKLRHLLQRQGVTISQATLSGALPQMLHGAPAGLGAAIKAAAISSALSPANPVLLKGVLKTMAWTKAKTMIIASALVLLAAGTTTVAIKQFSSPSIEDVFNHISEDHYLNKAPAVVVLRPSSHNKLGMRVSHMHGPPFSTASERFVGINHPLSWVLSIACDVGPEQMVFPPDLPGGTFDFLVAVPTAPKKALLDEIKKQFGLVAHTEIQQRDVLVLRVSDPNAPGLKVNQSHSTDHGINVAPGSLKLVNFAMSGMTARVVANASDISVIKTNLDDSIVRILAGYIFHQPVIDETGLTDSYDIDLRWDANLKDKALGEAFIRALREQLGLEVISTNLPVSIVVIDYETPHEIEEPLAKSAWAFVGYGTPEEAFQSALWAMSSGETKKFMDSLTPDYQKRFMQADGRGKSDSRIAADNKRKAAEIVSFQVINKENLSADESVLYLRSTRLGNARVNMKKINGEWKMDGEPH